MKPRLILCATDFSPPSRAAFEAAAGIARDDGARLLLVHVEPAVQAPPEVAGFVAEVAGRADEGLEAQLAGWRRDALELGAGDVETRLLGGAAAEAIVALAREVSCDLIVMGTHGRTGIRHLILGSVAETVVREAPCSVLVSRQRPRT